MVLLRRWLVNLAIGFRLTPRPHVGRRGVRTSLGFEEIDTAPRPGGRRTCPGRVRLKASAQDSSLFSKTGSLPVQPRFRGGRRGCSIKTHLQGARTIAIQVDVGPRSEERGRGKEYVSTRRCRVAT